MTELQLILLTWVALCTSGFAVFILIAERKK